VSATTASKPLVIDSSGWLEYITRDTKHDLFAPYFADESRIRVPMIVLYEVRKVLLARASKHTADYFVATALQLEMISIDSEIALSAATLSLDYKLPMADALIYASAQDRNATLITSDSHFQNLPDVTLL
jgi:predicted nucleic acid-binding protein